MALRCANTTTLTRSLGYPFCAALTSHPLQKRRALRYVNITAPGSRAKRSRLGYPLCARLTEHPLQNGMALRLATLDWTGLDWTGLDWAGLAHFV